MHKALFINLLTRMLLFQDHARLPPPRATTFNYRSRRYGRCYGGCYGRYYGATVVAVGVPVSGGGDGVRGRCHVGGVLRPPYVEAAGHPLRGGAAGWV
jgi:hypothetical protein